MAGHAQLKFVMTECSKTQIRLTRPNFDLFISVTIFFFSQIHTTRPGLIDVRFHLTSHNLSDEEKVKLLRQIFTITLAVRSFESY